ncbi:MAG: threo-3-hydroxy-L-aspartate ammonia-lyase [Gammaproteobacteria bacterium]|nr:threo-3-hydroxy-L-aspartate ammonia-lyase [Gammaproteobacteria bacterium]
MTDAHKGLHTQAHRTAIVTSRTLNKRVNAEVFLKCENLQRIGAFKFRGAYNAISRLTPAQRERGIVTHSSGNHAQAVALAASLFDANATVIMPADAPTIKRRATEQYGAKVIDYDTQSARREDITKELIDEHGYTLIPPFDHPNVIAGQGTAALELFEDLESLDMLLVPCGGGGLLSGSAISAKALNPACKVIGIEPEQADDAVRSFRSGTLQSIKNPKTIADGTRTESLGEITFELIKRYVDDIQAVSEQAIMDAVRFLFYRTKLVVEPSGALGVAALLSDVVKPTGRVGIILSGGNVDGETMCQTLKQESAQ